MKPLEEVIALFRDKYEYLKNVCQQQLGPFNESAIYQNPDGGWQLNLEQPFDYKAAITLRPNDEVPYETHGVIGARWVQEGGAFDANGIPGRLGYPVSDEENIGDISLRLPSLAYETGGTTQLWKSQSIEVSRTCSQFEFGRIEWCEGITWDHAAENLNYDAFRACLLEYESSKDNLYWSGPLFDTNCPAPPRSLIYLYDVEPLTGADIRNFFENYADAHHCDGSYHFAFAISPSLSVTLTEKRK